MEAKQWFRRKMDRYKPTKVTARIPFRGVTLEWETSRAESRAAWELYVELSTRIATQPLPGDGGLFREALTSLYSLFPITREILRNAGPDVGGNMPSVGAIAVEVLNEGLRPFLTKWHPELLNWESSRSQDISPRDHERAWPDHETARRELEILRGELQVYAAALREIVGLPREKR
jgi:hypothetical protein